MIEDPVKDISDVEIARLRREIIDTAEIEKRKTVGAISLELSKRDPGTHSADEQMREQLTDYEKNLYECIKANKNLYTDDFYIVVLVKKEKLMQNVLRGLFFARQSCPTPDYDQTVYRYHKLEEKLEFMWVIPASNVVNFMSCNPQLVEPDKYELLSFVLKFIDGSLLGLAKQLNSERKDSNIIDK
jgi:hypothetical protein